MTPTAPGTPEAIDDCSRTALYKIYRDYLQHEDSLINYRLTWNLSGQTFLFAAFGVSLGKVVEMQEKLGVQLCAKLPATTLSVNVGMPGGETNILWHVSHWLLPVLGVGLATVSYVGIRAAQRALFNLERLWQQSEKVYEALAASGAVPKAQEARAQEAIANAWDFGASRSSLHPVLPKLTGGGRKGSAKIGKFISVATPVLIGGGWAILLVLCLFINVTIPCVRPLSRAEPADLPSTSTTPTAPPLAPTAINFQPNINLQPTVNVQSGCGSTRPLLPCPSSTPAPPPSSLLAKPELANIQ